MKRICSPPLALVVAAGLAAAARKSALPVTLAAAMLVFVAAAAVAQDDAEAAPAEEKTQAETKQSRANAVDDERVRAGDTQITRGGKTRFSGLVRIGKNRTMYLECIGAGSPTVVYIAGGFEAGWISKYALYSTDLVLEEPVDSFSDGRGDVQKLDRAVFPTAGTLTRVCNYDRPNTTLRDDIDLERGGQASTPVTQPHTVEADVADLRALLAAAKVPGPYVLVAHSYGGLIAEFYARTHPKEVAGRVHIDVTNEFLLDTFTEEELRGLDELKPPTPDGETPLVLDALHSVRNAPAPAQKPVFVLSADKPRTLQPESLGTLQRVRDAHDLLAAQLCAKHMKRTNSGHHMFAEQPQLVNDAVREVVEAVRKGCATIPCKGVPPKTDPSIALVDCRWGKKERGG